MRKSYALKLKLLSYTWIGTELQEPDVRMINESILTYFVEYLNCQYTQRVTKLKLAHYLK